MRLTSNLFRLLKAHFSAKGTLILCLIMTGMYVILLLLVNFFHVSQDDFLTSIVLIRKGELWKSFPSIFFHQGWGHLFSNLFIVALLGPFIEKTIHPTAFVISFLSIGLTADFIYAYIIGPFIQVSLGPVAYATPLIGASSAGLGLIPLAIAAATIRKPPMAKRTWIFFTLLILLLILMNLPGLIGDIEEQITDLCHLAGILGGVLFSIVMLLCFHFRRAHQTDPISFLRSKYFKYE